MVELVRILIYLRSIHTFFVLEFFWIPLKYIYMPCVALFIILRSSYLFLVMKLEYFKIFELVKDGKLELV